MTAHFRVMLIVQELDADGNCIEVVSKHMLADYPNDDDGSSIGQMADDYYNKVVRNCVHGKLT